MWFPYQQYLFSKLSSTHFILTIEITLTKLQIEVTKKILYLSLSLLYDFIASPQVVLQEVLEDEKTYAFIFR